MATGEHRPVLVPRLVAVWEPKLVKDHVLQCRELAELRTVPVYVSAARECHSWREEFPNIQRSVVLLCGACFDCPTSPHHTWICSFTRAVCIHVPSTEGGGSLTGQTLHSVCKKKNRLRTRLGGGGGGGGVAPFNRVSLKLLLKTWQLWFFH